MIRLSHTSVALPGSPARTTIFGLDLSLTATGIAALLDNDLLDFGVIKSKATGAERLDEIRENINRLIDNYENETMLAAVEGYGFATQKAHALGELGGLIRWTLWRRGIRTILVPPATLKKFVTGKGVGDKGQMMVELFKNWGVDAGDNNAADACALAIMGYHWMCPDMTAPKYRQEATTKVEVLPARAAPTTSPVRKRTRTLQLVSR